MIKKIREKDAWRRYLRGEYVIKNVRFEDKMRYEIRERAEEMMSALLLICEKSSERDKIMIFKNPRTRRSLVLSLVKTLLENANTSKGEEELEDAMRLGDSLQLKSIKFSVPLLVRSAAYRQKKHIELLCKWGLSRKNAKKIATGEAQKIYPTARSPQPLI